MSAHRRRIAVWPAVGAGVAGLITWSLWPQPVPVDFATVARGPMVGTVEEEGRTRVRPSSSTVPTIGPRATVAKSTGTGCGHKLHVISPATPAPTAGQTAMRRRWADMACSLV